MHTETLTHRHTHMQTHTQVHIQTCTQKREKACIGHKIPGKSGGAHAFLPTQTPKLMQNCSLDLWSAVAAR